MRFRFTLWALALSLNSVAAAQSLSVDLLTPEETPDPIPADFRVVDIFYGGSSSVQALGFRVVTENGATMNFWDSDPVTPGVQPGFVNVGVANQFYSSVSLPRGRNEEARFTNAGSFVLGAYDPGGPTPEFSENLLNIAYFASPPESARTGYVGRVSVDISATGLPTDYSQWGAGPLSNIPPGSVVVLRSVGLNQPGGTAYSTFDEPGLNFINWGLWAVPEPSSLLLLSTFVLISRRRG